MERSVALRVTLCTRGRARIRACGALSGGRKTDVAVAPIHAAAGTAVAASVRPVPSLYERKDQS
jgi:hypothetical protein